MRGKQVTRDMVKAVQTTKARYPEMSNKDVAKLCDTSETTTSKILSGAYNHLLADDAPDGEVAALLEGLLEQQRRTCDMLHVVGVMLANYLVVRDEDRSAAVKRLHNLNPELNFKELDKQ